MRGAVIRILNRVIRGLVLEEALLELTDRRHREQEELLVGVVMAEGLCHHPEFLDEIIGAEDEFSGILIFNAHLPRNWMYHHVMITPNPTPDPTRHVYPDQGYLRSGSESPEESPVARSPP